MKKYWIHKHIEYLKDNPQGYWFKRKLYGFGWVPVRWQGWLVVLGYVAIVLAFAFTREESIPGNPDSGTNMLVFALPIFLLTALLIYICYKKGEKPKWMWGLPEKFDNLKVLITGMSGTGKTTTGRKLKEMGYSVIDIDYEDGVCHFRNRDSKHPIPSNVRFVLNKDFIDSHEWFCDIKVLKEAVEKMKSPVFIIGMPENRNELMGFADKVILLQCEPETFLRRVIDRTDNDFGKEESIQEYLHNEYQQTERNILSKGATPINTEKSVEEVVKEVLSIALGKS